MIVSNTAGSCGVKYQEENIMNKRVFSLALASALAVSMMAPTFDWYSLHQSLRTGY